MTVDFNSITRINENMFNSNLEVRDIVLSEGITDIGACAFFKCYNLESVKYPSTLETIGNNAFYKCIKLDNIDLSNTKVELIPIECFHREFKLKNLRLPNNLKKIDFLAFDSCYELEELWIPDSVQELQYCAFSNCSTLKTIHLSKELYAKIKPEFDKIFTNCFNIETIDQL